MSAIRTRRSCLEPNVRMDVDVVELSHDILQMTVEALVATFFRPHTPYRVGAVSEHRTKPVANLNVIAELSCDFNKSPLCDVGPNA